jgi:hypothetical protein
MFITDEIFVIYIFLSSIVLFPPLYNSSAEIRPLMWETDNFFSSKIILFGECYMMFCCIKLCHKKCIQEYVKLEYIL